MSAKQIQRWQERWPWNHRQRQAKLLKLYPSLTSSLASALEARMKLMVDGLQKKLTERADKEANDIESILTELKKSMKTELKALSYIQATLFDDPEQERFERNRVPCEPRREIPWESNVKPQHFGHGSPTRRLACFPWQ